MKMKKVVSLLAAMAMTISLAACGSGNDAETPDASAGDGAAGQETAGDAPSQDAAGETDTAAGAEDASQDTSAGESKALLPFDEPVVIKMGHGLNPNVVLDEGETVENSRFVQWLKNDMNIEVQYDWICASTDFGQKINLCIASNKIGRASCRERVSLWV